MDDTGRLIPRPEMAPSVPESASREECIALWFDLIDATDEIFLANLRGQGLSPAEVEVAYRECYARQVEEHDRTVRHMMIEFNRRWKEYEARRQQTPPPV
jgi:hypothetical protein